jgi:hypothetical protein
MNKVFKVIVLAGVELGIYLIKKQLDKIDKVNQASNPQ